MPPGRLETALLQLFTRSATVSRVDRLSAHFHRVTLTGDALKGVAWTPGQKIQVQLGGLVSRTYTPASWNSAVGATHLVAFSHGDAPAARWVTSLKAGDLCLVRGPRRSLDLTDLRRPAVFFGDETSLGLAQALQATPHAAHEVAFLFEVSSIAQSRSVLDTLGVSTDTLVERTTDDGHLAEVEVWISRALRERAPEQFVLSGKAASIQRITQALKRHGVSSSQLKVKAYWAPGKTGLD